MGTRVVHSPTNTQRMVGWASPSLSTSQSSAAPAAAAAAAGAPQSGSSVNKHNNKNNYKISKTQRFPYPMSIPAITVVP
jgi:hypothetical protein